ncbi:M20/M25/M40 family metallo-hydrolase [Pyxidicoccus parkwayensis]|uniref:M20/M25/M40 family metallo-hydrolase n=1 Tax=Pyxidicoccus parkwayensis TaxID=2813578 RepID=A0ABX7P6I9_9BACT|nr:M28 family metallopeptidase [Pyxidicoccus parkwaysis]QSQ26069.1 M20/M25/M40 family metallo-hydrolase [Pyxidicoccus parkwaysis]
MLRPPLLPVLALLAAPAAHATQPTAAPAPTAHAAPAAKASPSAASAAPTPAAPAAKASPSAASAAPTPAAPAAHAAPATRASSAALSPEAERWWSHVRFLASDALKGRDTGSEGYQKAATYVSEQLAALGVKPVSGDSYLQEMDLVSRRLVEERSRLALIRNGKEVPLVLGTDAILSARTGETGTVEAPLVFVGYGLSIPEAGHDDFAGLDLQGKVAVILYGGPSNISGPLRAHYASSAERVKALKKAGAVGVVVLQNPKHLEVPWSRAAGARKMPSMQFADASLNEGQGMKVSVTFNAARTEPLFAGSPYTFKEILALADADKPLPHFELPTRIKTHAEFVDAPLESANVVGVLPGSDPALAKEYVVLSAHLDHVGVGEPVKGDRIYNGAMDNATGVAAVLEVARALQAAKPKRSVLFALVTGEEKGLLGSKYLTARPPVPTTSMVANFNLDMFLPLFPLTRLMALGQEESSLGMALQQVAAARGVTLMPDPEPNQMRFIRSDQYSFILKGVPALAFKFGFDKDTPEEKRFKAWYTERYHAPSDDLSQPMDKEGAASFVQILADLARSVADAPEPPRWNADSFFRRFDTSGRRGGTAATTP